MLSAFGTTELIIILALAVLIFGASRLPQLGKGLGEGIRGFRDSLRGDDKKNLDDGSTPPPAKKDDDHA